MALEHISEPSRRLPSPLATFVIAALLAVGLGAGAIVFRVAIGTSTIPAAPAAPAGPAAGGGGAPANGAGVPVPGQVVPLDACQAMDALARSVYCGSAGPAHGAPPRATWQSCEAMDATAFRMYCSPGDGGRGLDGARAEPTGY